MTGFALVNKYCHLAENAHSIGEFYVKPEFRRRGIGKRTARSVFGLFPGNWEVFELRRNEVARSFRLKTIRDFTRGRFRDLDVANGECDGYVQIIEN